MKAKNTLTILIVVSLIALTLALVLGYGIYDIRSKNQKTSELLQQADKIANEDVEFQSIRSVLGSIQEDIEEFDKYTLTEARVVPMVEKIETVGRKLGLETNTTSISVAKPEGTASSTEGVKKIKIVVETKGEKTPTMTFLGALESLPYRIMIDESSVIQEEGGWRSRTSFAVYTF
jgi:Tfp pilus assembly protein PilO